MTSPGSRLVKKFQSLKAFKRKSVSGLDASEERVDSGEPSEKRPPSDHLAAQLGNGICQQSHDPRVTNGASLPLSSADILDTSELDDSAEAIGLSRLNRTWEGTSRPRMRENYKRRTVYLESLSSHDLTGRASLSAKDLIFGIPPPPVLPPRMPLSMRRSVSTPDIPKPGSREDREDRDSVRRSKAAETLSAMKRLSVVDVSDVEEESESEDSYMDWSDDNTSVSSAQSPTGRSREDFYENLDFQETPGQVTPGKARLVAHELMTSEEAYVQKLEILSKARIRAIEILGNDTAKDMFPYINSIYTLHKENMLPHLKERLLNWDSNPQIGDIMKTFAPYLKLYTDYVKNFDKALKLVDTWNAKNSDFSKMLKSLPASGPSQTLNLKLQIKSYMLEPVQRVPRYQLLLQQYSKQLLENSTEKSDLQVAVTMITQAASHFEDMMTHGTKMLEMMDVQRQVETPISLIATGRHLLKQGRIGKVHATTGKVVSRYVFLFNDLFLVCSEQTFHLPGFHPKYKARHMMEVEGMQVADGDSLDVPYTFYVKTRKKALELAASDDTEKIEWQQMLWQVIGDTMRMKVQKANTLMRRRTMMLRAEGPLGKEAPIWVHNSQVSMCMMCAATFRGLKRKHHCRACGEVVCNRCSSRVAAMQYDENTEHRVCDECYLVLEDDKERRQSLNKSRARELCVQSGYLHVSPDGGKTWHRRWFEVHEGQQLYCFKLQQDICPMFHVPLDECRTEMGTLDGTGKVILLTTNNAKNYIFREERPERLPRWFDALKSEPS